MFSRQQQSASFDNEEDLVRRAIQGDSDAFGVLYTTHLKPIYRYIYYRVGDILEAEDLTEDVFIKAWEALPGYQIKAHPFKSWLYRIAHNLIVDFHRKKRPISMAEPEVYNNSSHLPSIEKAVETWENAETLAEAVKSLNPEQQQVILLRFVEGLSHQEVGVIIGKSEASSRVIQHRALAALLVVMRKDKKHV